MPEPIFYMRGFPTPPIEQRAASDPFTQNLKLIASLSDEQIDAFSNRLFEAKGFLDPRRLSMIAREVLGSQAVAEAAFSALLLLSPSDVERFLEHIEKLQQSENSPFDEATLLRLKGILPKLIKQYPALVRFRKAERLEKATGNAFESVELICDFRPIFDEAREVLEGMIPYTRLRMVATGADGLPRALEAELTYQQVVELAERAEKAKGKLDVLRKYAEQWLPDGIPELHATRVIRKDSKDV